MGKYIKYLGIEQESSVGHAVKPSVWLSVIDEKERNKIAFRKVKAHIKEVCGKDKELAKKVFQLFVEQTAINGDDENNIFNPHWLEQCQKQKEWAKAVASVVRKFSMKPLDLGKHLPTAKQASQRIKKYFKS